jgi:hypothetical protein
MRNTFTARFYFFICLLVGFLFVFFNLIVEWQSPYKSHHIISVSATLSAPPTWERQKRYPSISLTIASAPGHEYKIKGTAYSVADVVGILSELQPGDVVDLHYKSPAYSLLSRIETALMASNHTLIVGLSTDSKVYLSKEQFVMKEKSEKKYLLLMWFVMTIAAALLAYFSYKSGF